MSEQDSQRLKEIDAELKRIRALFDEYHSWYDKKTGKVWFPPNRYFNYDELVEREFALGTERKVICERLKDSA